MPPALRFSALALPLSAGDEWKPIFNGKNVSGWEHVGPGPFGFKPKKVQETLKELLRELETELAPETNTTAAALSASVEHL